MFQLPRENVYWYRFSPPTTRHAVCMNDDDDEHNDNDDDDNVHPKENQASNDLRQ